jgi:predicted alpha/beta-fold hydrolase
LIPVESIQCWPLSATVCREITATGGHLGFVARSRAPGWFWAAERMLDFVAGHTT